eukprot:TRINITY_DN24478_c0_g1_i1.p1 TRINITY_DN24478_c0_g1~~TRINITY_DN24478_c0_g1_i1.p1  ORF type:complete len:486 (-),score=142.25 TRINITY_DN24478_c0_g1_i1:293-1750(-)
MAKKGKKPPAEEAATSSAKRAKMEKEDAKAAAELPEDFEDDDEDFEEEGEEAMLEEPESEEDVEDGDGEQTVKHVFRPGIDKVEEGEQLAEEPGTYTMLHRAQVEWPCLSFDVMRDDLGASRTAFPMTSYIVSGTQAENAADNKLYVMKWSKLYKTSKDGKDSDDEDDDDEDSDEDSEDEHEAALDQKGVAHPGAVNRIRCLPQASHIVSTWADTGKVHVWNLENQRKALDNPATKAATTAKPIFSFDGHGDEGFALDFNPKETGRLLTGCNSGSIFLWEPAPGGWKVQTDSPFKGHGKFSVEDIQWKKHGDGSQSLFASCSSDKSFRVWDVREKNRSKSAVHVPKAHTSDVNVLSWSPCVGELLATGSDDGAFKIWDTRNTSAGPMANFKWHPKPITSIDWHPSDETVLIVASEDDCVSIWDMAVEDDDEGAEKPPGAEHYPAQLLFLHQGQKDPKEVRWHPQLPGVAICTAASGFNIFKTCNM